MMRRVLEAPERAGLVAHAREYRYAGSDTFVIDDWRVPKANAHGRGRT